MTAGIEDAALLLPGSSRDEVDKAVAWDAIAEKNSQIEKLKSLLVRVDALGRTPGWKRMPDGGLFCSTPLAGDISAALEQSKEK